MLISLILLAGLFAGLFLLGEAFYWQAHWPAENSRKFVHITVGALSLTFPLFFENFWPVALLCAVFLLILKLSRRFNFLPSINKVKRRTVGSLLFPVVVAVCFWLNLERQNVLYFYSPILIMAVCDPLAAIAGKAAGEDEKSWQGFGAFLLSAFIFSMALFSWAAPMAWQPLLLSTLAMALATALAEYFSKNGWDNLSVPVAAVIALFIIENSGAWN